MASACEKCGYFPVRCKCEELQLQAELDRYKTALQEIAEKSQDHGHFADQALTDGKDK